MDDLTTPPGRLRAARRRANWKSARAFALAHGVDETTYRRHEAKPGAPGHRSFYEDSAQTYADALGVNWMWLLYGDKVAPMTGSPASANTNGVDEKQAAAALRPILAGFGLDAEAARPVARALLKAIRAAQGLPEARLNERDFEIAGNYAAQESAREFKR